MVGGVARRESDGAVLMARRPPGGRHGGLWEFPGGKVEAGETPEDCLRREVKGRIGVDIEVRQKLGEHVHEYSNYSVQMTMFACELRPGAHPRALTVNDLRWVASRDFFDYDFPPADEGTMTKLLGLIRN